MQALIVWLAKHTKEDKGCGKAEAFGRGGIWYRGIGLDWFVHTTVGFVFAVLGTGRNHS